jgi:hypothetical protein
VKIYPQLNFCHGDIPRPNSVDILRVMLEFVNKILFSY